MLKFLTPLLLILGLSASCAGPAAPSGPDIVKGRADCSGIDLSAQVIKLSGLWEFYPSEFITPGTPGLQPREWVAVPGRWDRTPLSNGQKFPETGFASYRLVLEHLQAAGPLALRVPTITSSAAVFFNGQLVKTIGQPGKTAAESRPFTQTETVVWDRPTDRLEIVLHVSNFHDVVGNFFDHLTLGPAATLGRTHDLALAFDVFLFGCIFIFCLQSLSLYLMRFQQIGWLYFGLFCLFISLRTLVNGENFISIWIPDFSWEWRTRLEVLSFYAGSPFFMLFLQDQFKGIFHKPVLWASIGFGIVFSAILLVTPVSVFGHTILIYQLGVIVQGVYCLYVTITATLKRVENGRLSLLGFAVLFVTIVNDILFFQGVIFTAYLTPFGLLGNIFCHYLILSRAFVKSLEKSEALAKVLAEDNEKLEQKVKERTHDLEQAGQEKTNFFVNLAHETRTPLTVINNYFSSYLAKVAETPELVVIKSNLDKLQRDIINFLDAEKLEQHRVFYDHQKIVDFSQLTQSKVELFQKTAGLKKQRLTVTAEPGLSLAIDPFAADRILNNLLDNAIKYTPNGGEISVAVTARDQRLVLKVQDNGIGIPQDLQANLFKPYHQLSSRKRNVQGLGMGLFILKKILEETQGDIAVESGEGQGTSFTLSWPLQSEPGETVVPSAPGKVQPMTIAPDSEEAEDGRPHLLLVEDNLEMLAYLQSELSRDYQIFTATDGVEALEKAFSLRRLDLIISDIMMDRMDGKEFYRRFRESKVHSGTPVLFLTAKANQHLKIESLESGILEFIQKPFDLAELQARIKSVLANANALLGKGYHTAIEVLSQFRPGAAPVAITVKDESAPDFDTVCRQYLLTERQKEVARFLVDGLENKEIAGRLDLSVKTVGNHIQTLYEKLGVHNRVEFLRLFLGNAASRVNSPGL